MGRRSYGTHGWVGSSCGRGEGGARPAWGVAMGCDTVVAGLQGCLGISHLEESPRQQLAWGSPEGPLYIAGTPGWEGDGSVPPCPCTGTTPEPSGTSRLQGHEPRHPALPSAAQLPEVNSFQDQVLDGDAVSRRSQFSCPLVGWSGVFFRQFTLSPVKLLPASVSPRLPFLWNCLPLQAGDPQRPGPVAASGEPADRAAPGSGARAAPGRALGDLRRYEAELRNRQRAGTAQGLTLPGSDRDSTAAAAVKPGDGGGHA